MTDGIMGDVQPTDTEPTVTQEPISPAITDALKDKEHQTANTAFLDTLPEALREVPVLKSVKDASDLATQFVNQQQMLGNSLRIPTEDTAEEQKEAFYQKLKDVPGVIRVPGEGAKEEEVKQFKQQLGVPETPDSYNIKVPEGTTLEANYIQDVTKRGHELGLTNEQLNKVVADDLAHQAKANEEYTTYVNKSREALKSIWSSDYETRVAGATNAMRIYSQEMPEYAEELKSMADNALFVKIMADLGEKLQEKGHAGMQTAGNYGMNVDEAKEKISEIMSNPDHPYFQGDKDAVERMLKYNEIVAGASA